MFFRVNEITKFLDMYAETNRMFSHYIVYEKRMFEDIILIRVPGGTVGNIFILFQQEYPYLYRWWDELLQYA